MTTTPPGWYDDQTGSGALRYWDGQGWTQQTRPQPQPAGEQFYGPAGQLATQPQYTQLHGEHGRSGKSRGRGKPVLIAIGSVFGVFLLIGIIGAALGGGDSGTVTAATADESSTQAVEAAGVGVVGAYRTTFPDLAEGRSDKAIIDDAKNTCLDIAQGKDRSVLIKNVSARAERNGMTPSTAQAEKILALWQREQCPSGTVAAAKPPASTSKAPAKPATPGVGDTVKDGKFAFTVTKVESGKTKIGSEYLSTKAQGVFVLVHVTVKNIGDKPQAFFGDNQRVFDAKGREFSADTEAAIYMGDDAQSLWEEINPGNQVKGIIVFDVPKDVKPVKIELHDSLFSGGVEVRLSK